MLILGLFLLSSLWLEVQELNASPGGGVLLLFSEELGFCPFGVGAYRQLVSISGPQCKILERPPHMTNQAL